MGKWQRTKGAVYEREIAQKFSDALDHDFKRNIGQARDGGNDIDVGPLVIECKRRASLATLEGWMRQADAAAQRRLQDDPTAFVVPLVVARADAGRSMAILDLNDFIVLTQDEIKRDLVANA